MRGGKGGREGGMRRREGGDYRSVDGGIREGIKWGWIKDVIHYLAFKQGIRYK